MQREERKLGVAGQLQLLARRRQHLLDFGKGPVVAVARQIVVLLLQRLLRRLCVRELALQLRELRVDVMDGRERLVRLPAQFGRLRVDSLLTSGHARVEPIDLAIERIDAHTGRARHEHDKEP